MQKGVIQLKHKPSILSVGTVGGKKEHDGPLGKMFDHIDETDTFGMPTWEQSESEMQRIALNTAMEAGGMKIHDIDAIFAGDLINQCTSSGYGLAGFDVPFFGLFGACSTIAEGLCLASMLVDSGKFDRAAAVTSSHNCSAERQFRYPLEYGGQRPPTAQWTVTGSAALILGQHDKPPYITEVLPGRVTDKGINDANNMGAAMAPAAIDTLKRYFTQSKKSPDEFSAIFTGDLGYEGSGILIDLLRAEGIDIGRVHHDCGLMIYDRERQDMHAGGSGCGCGATVLAGHILPRMRELALTDVLFVATGAMMSPGAVQQGLTIPGIAHLVHISMSEG
ncbi:MAG: stage V sporulation protein AD [Clostridia bacterium]|nr:stage V sporulation protein AD [Clostridia bacterium]